MYPQHMYPPVEQFETKARRLAEQRQLAAQIDAMRRPRKARSAWSIGRLLRVTQPRAGLCTAQGQ